MVGIVFHTTDFRRFLFYFSPTTLVFRKVIEIQTVFVCSKERIPPISMTPSNVHKNQKFRWASSNAVCSCLLRERHEALSPYDNVSCPINIDAFLEQEIQGHVPCTLSTSEKALPTTKLVERHPM